MTQTVAGVVGLVATAVATHLAVRPLRVRLRHRVVAVSDPVGTYRQLMAAHDDAEVGDIFDQHRRRLPAAGQRCAPLFVQAAGLLVAGVLLLSRSGDSAFSRSAVGGGVPAVAAVGLTAVSVIATWLRLRRRWGQVGQQATARPDDEVPASDLPPASTRRGSWRLADAASLLGAPVALAAALAPIGVLVLVATWCLCSWADPQQPTTWAPLPLD